MNVLLDYEQRLYLTVMLGNTECRTIGDTRAAWQLIDRLSLNDAEQKEIALTTHVVEGGMEAFSWDRSKSSMNPREFYLSHSDVQQLARAIGACPRFLPREARRWLEPLLRQLPQLEDTNGSRAGTKP